MDDAHRRHLLNTFRGNRWAAAALCLFVAALAGNARVFWRWGAAQYSTRVMEAAGGRIAYRAAVTLNGGSGNLTVFSFDQPPYDVAAKLRAAFDSRQIRPGTGALQMGTITANGRVLRLVMLAPGRPSRTLVFLVDQDRTEAARSAVPPVRPLPDLPALPDAETQLYLRDHETRTGFAVCLSNTHPSDAAAFYADRLRADGWARAGGTHSPDPAGPALLLFERNHELCCVYVEARPDAHATRVAVVHRQGSLSANNTP